MKLTQSAAKSVHELLDLLKAKYVEGFELDPPYTTLFVHSAADGEPIFDLKVTLAPPGHYLKTGDSDEKS